MNDRSIDRITSLLNANREASKLQEELQHRRQEQAKQARLDKIAATQRKHAEEAVDVVMRDGADRLIE